MIDWQRVSDLEAEIGSDDFEEVADLFLAEMEEELAGLNAASGDAKAMRDRFHAMKGSALNLGFQAFAELCSTGEALAEDGCSTGVDIQTLVAQYAESKSVFLGRATADTTELPRSGDAMPQYP